MMKFEEGWLKRQADRAAKEVASWSPEKKATILCAQGQHEFYVNNEITEDGDFVGVICENCGYDDWKLIESNFQDHWLALTRKIQYEQN